MTVMDRPLRSYAKEPPLEAIVESVLAGSGRSLATALNLPAAAYTSQAFFDLEVEKIFKQDWLCVGHLSQLPNVGDYYTVDLFDDLLLVVRGPDRVRVLSRVCLHRWAPIVAGSGHAASFVCPFHNWTYGLDGRLIAAPYMHKAEGLDLAACRLPEMRTEIVEELGLIFVTHSPTAAPIGPRLADLVERLKNFRLKDAVGVRPTQQDVPFNWKIFIETGQECYHHFSVHKDTLEAHRPSALSWCEAGTPSWTVCHSPLTEDSPQELATYGLPNFPDLSRDELRSIALIHIFPLTRLLVNPDKVQLKCIVPVGLKRTRSFNIYLVTPEVAAQKQLIEERFSHVGRTLRDQQLKEDLGIDAQQQMGAYSSHAKPGRLSHLEASLWHMHEYIRRALSAA